MDEVDAIISYNVAHAAKTNVENELNQAKDEVEKCAAYRKRLDDSLCDALRHFVPEVTISHLNDNTTYRRIQKINANFEYNDKVDRLEHFIRTRKPNVLDKFSPRNSLDHMMLELVKSGDDFTRKQFKEKCVSLGHYTDKSSEHVIGRKGIERNSIEVEKPSQIVYPFYVVGGTKYRASYAWLYFRHKTMKS